MRLILAAWWATWRYLDRRRAVVGRCTSCSEPLDSPGCMPPGVHSIYGGCADGRYLDRRQP